MSEKNKLQNMWLALTKRISEENTYHYFKRTIEPNLKEHGISRIISLLEYVQENTKEDNVLPVSFYLFFRNMNGEGYSDKVKSAYMSNNFLYELSAEPDIIEAVDSMILIDYHRNDLYSDTIVEIDGIIN